jgi:hypothetical protein
MHIKALDTHRPVAEGKCAQEDHVEYERRLEVAVIRLVRL